MRLFLILIFLNITFFSSADTLSLNTADTAPYSTKDKNGFYDILLIEAMSNLGIDLLINHYPSERSILWADQGHDDGEFGRILGLSNTFTNLIAVEESLIIFNFVAIKKSENRFNITSWNDLNGLRVGFLNGWKIYEEKLSNSNNVRIVQNIDSLFDMLLNDRLDVILFSRLRAEDYINKKAITGVSIIDPPLAVKSMHLYIHKKHESLIPLINKELKNLKETGRYNEIKNNYLINR